MTRSIAYLRIQLCIEKIIADISERLSSPNSYTAKEIYEMSELFLELKALNNDELEQMRLQK